MQVGELALEKHVIVVGTGDVAGAAGTGATVVDRLLHGIDHELVLPHAEIVVGAPDGDFLGAVFGVAGRARKIAALAFQISEDAVAAFLVKPRELILEKRLEIHA